MIKVAVMEVVHQIFPNVKIAYKDHSLLMRVLSTLLFFNPLFMRSYITVLGNTVYFPSDHYPNSHPVSSFIVLLHELVHVYDQDRLSKPLFSILYLFPQILFLPTLLLFLISWKIALPLILLTLLPWPAYFRMIFEKRAYLASLYVIHCLNNKYHYNINLHQKKQFFIEQFKDSYYYYVWPFKSLDNDFNQAIKKILQGSRPYEDHIFDILDRLILLF